jgi:hypothetical protein
MKKTLITILFLYIAINLSAQKSDLIIGKWVFTEALNKDLDESQLAYIKAEIVGKWELYFKSDGKFDSQMMEEKNSGEWKYNPNSNSIVLTGIEGGPQEFLILKLTENQLALKLGLGEFLLTRIKE